MFRIGVGQETGHPQMLHNEWFCPDENAIRTGYLPYTVSAGTNADMVAYWNENPLPKVAYDQLEYATYNEWSVYLEQWRDKIAAAFAFVITDESMTPEQAVNFLRTQAEAIFS